MERQHDLLIKIILIGDSGVGKTNILRRFVQKEFDLNTKPTIGVDFQTSEFKYKEKIVKVQFWDTAGQEKYQAITGSYYKQAHGAIIVYDITNLKSFENLPKWQKDLKKTMNEKIKVLILGNKKDLIDERQVYQQTAQEFCQQNNYQFYESSAKQGENISNSFEQFFQSIIEEQLSLIRVNSQQFFNNF